MRLARSQIVADWHEKFTRYAAPVFLGTAVVAAALAMNLNA